MSIVAEATFNSKETVMVTKKKPTASEKKRRDAKQCQHAVRAGHLSEKWVNYDGGYGHGGWPCLEVGTLLVG